MIPPLDPTLMTDLARTRLRDDLQRAERHRLAQTARAGAEVARAEARGTQQPDANAPAGRRQLLGLVTWLHVHLGRSPRSVAS